MKRTFSDALVSADAFVRRAAIVATVAALGVFCVVVIQLSSLPFVSALECAASGQGPFGGFPFQKTICRQHMFFFRGSPADIASLQDSGGAMALLAEKPNAPTVAERAQLLGFVAKHGLDINAKESDSWTPLHVAIRDNNIENLDILLRLHPSLGIKAGPDERTPMELARALGREEMVARLVAEEQLQLHLASVLQAQGRQLDEIQLYGGEFAGMQGPSSNEMQTTD